MRKHHFFLALRGVFAVFGVGYRGKNRKKKSKNGGRRKAETYTVLPLKALDTQVLLKYYKLGLLYIYRLWMDF